MLKSRCSCAFFLFLYCLVLWPSVEVNGAPGPISQVMGQVVDLLRVRLTWTVPSDNVTSYRITYCTDSLMCNSTTYNSTASSGTGVSFVLEHGAPLNSDINVTIVAFDNALMGAVGGGSIIPVATYDYAKPTNVRFIVLATTFAIVTWDLPMGATGEGIEISSYSVQCCNGFSGTASNTSRTFLFRNSGQTANSIAVTVVPQYTMPTGINLDRVGTTLSAEAYPNPSRPIQNVMPTLTRVTATVLDVNWNEPQNTQYLESYRVDATGTPVIQVDNRRKRQSGVTSNSTTVSVGTSQMRIYTCAYCDVTVMVTAIYQGGLEVPLLNPGTIRTAQSTPTAPREVRVAPYTGTSLRCTWIIPNPPNGVITNYVVVFSETSDPTSSRRESVQSTNTFYVIGNLKRLTSYSIQVLAVTTVGDGEVSAPINISTVGVTSPEISLNDREITFTVSRVDGSISSYQLILSTTSLDDSKRNGSIQPYSSDSRNLYVARVGSIATDQTTITVSFATGETTELGGVTYVDQGLQSNTEYYIFVRVFSSINESVFGDSRLVGPVRGPSAVNAVAIAVPIVVVYVLIMVLLVVVILLCWFLVRPAWKMRKEYNLRRKQGIPPPGSEALVERKSAKEPGAAAEGTEKEPPAEDSEKTAVQLEDEKVAD